MRLGAIADDVTGGTDLAGVLGRAGIDVVQLLGLPTSPLPPAEAVVISLKIRTAPPDDAVAATRAAAHALRRAGASQVFFKYCSTFDSTPDGNIGPVLDALLDPFEAELAVACPAYPTMARTVYAGHLFVGDQLLSDSPMRHHPLTPMTDANLVRWLGRQSRLPIGVVPLRVVEQGPAHLSGDLERLRAAGVRVAITDAVFDRHIEIIAEASEHLAVASGGAALGGAIGRRRVGARPVQRARFAGGAAPGPVAILSGSCSVATQEQVRRLGTTQPACVVDPLILAENGALDRLGDWCRAHGRSGRDVLVVSTDTPDGRARARSRFDASAAAAIVERAFQVAATALAEVGVRTFIVAGGETSGAVVQALGLTGLRFGAEIDPGVPWTESIEPPGFRLALKSGNFGGPDFFSKALGQAHGRD